jgi:hypothetical protein
MFLHKCDFVFLEEESCIFFKRKIILGFHIQKIYLAVVVVVVVVVVLVVVVVSVVSVVIAIVLIQFWFMCMSEQSGGK